jgi:hypothetical protein
MQNGASRDATSHGATEFKQSLSVGKLSVLSNFVENKV